MSNIWKDLKKCWDIKRTRDWTRKNTPRLPVDSSHGMTSSFLISLVACRSPDTRKADSSCVIEYSHYSWPCSRRRINVINRGQQWHLFHAWMRWKEKLHRLDVIGLFFVWRKKELAGAAGDDSIEGAIKRESIRSIVTRATFNQSASGERARARERGKDILWMLGTNIRVERRERREREKNISACIDALIWRSMIKRDSRWWVHQLDQLFGSELMQWNTIQQHQRSRKQAI